MKHLRTDAINSVKQAGLNKRVAYATLYAKCPFAYVNSATGVKEPLTMRVFDQWLREYDKHYAHKL